MPNGKTHDIITLIIAPIIGVITYYVLTDIKITMILMFTYFFASFMFNGDLDTNSKPYNRWFILKMIWIPYQLLFNHRSIFTHGLIIGTIIRIIYIGIIPLSIVVLHNNIQEVIIYIKNNFNIILVLVIGLELGSAIHTISDRIF